MSVAALFVRKDSHYKSMDGVDCYDMERDARSFAGTCPVVAHPPCRAWGRLRGFAKPRPNEKDLARWAVALVRRNGGVLEHPEGSTLWKDQDLPLPGEPADQYGGWTVKVKQVWFGHPCEKDTWLYLVGTKKVPEFTILTETPTHCIKPVMGKSDHLRICSKKWREMTPAPFAEWLVELARSCRKL